MLKKLFNSNLALFSFSLPIYINTRRPILLYLIRLLSCKRYYFCSVSYPLPIRIFDQKYIRVIFFFRVTGGRCISRPINMCAYTIVSQHWPPVSINAFKYTWWRTEGCIDTYTYTSGQLHMYVSLISSVHMQYTHAVYTCSIHMQYTHAVYKFSIHMQYTHAVYTCSIHTQVQTKTPWPSYTVANALVSHYNIEFKGFIHVYFSLYATI